MADTDPVSIDALPLFPLRLVLFPGALLPLHIFEVRYLDMVGRCLREHRPFGVVCLTEGQEVQQPAPAAGATFAAETFHELGTLAEIVEHDRPQPGLIAVRCRGSRRFRLTHTERLKHGLWVGHATLLPADAPLPVPSDMLPLASSLAVVLRRIEAQVADTTALPIGQPYRLDDCGWVANRWCELMPLPAPLKQRLLGIDSPLLRLELVADLLERLQLREQPPQPPNV
jgi:Lon protease-like protein